MIDAADDTRITIFRIENTGDASVRLAQYELISISALERKLAQYPKGTSFTLDVTPLDLQIAPVIAAKVMKFAAAQGLTMRR